MNKGRLIVMGNTHYKLISDSTKFLELHHVMKGRYCNILPFSVGFSAIKKKNLVLVIFYSQRPIFILDLFYVQILQGISQH